MNVVHLAEDAHDDWLADLASIVYRPAPSGCGQRRVNRKIEAIVEYVQEEAEYQ